MVQRLDVDSTWVELALPPAQQEQLRAVVLRAQRPEVATRTEAVPGSQQSGSGVSALLVGSNSGVRTKAAAVLARELGADLYRVDLSRVVSKYIGETEKRLDLLFDSAEKAGAVLYFDEADALFGRRTDVKDAHDRYANIEVDYLLQRIEAYDGLTILASNTKSSLDDAFMRRLRYVVDLSA